MTDNPNFGATEKDAEYRISFSGGLLPAIIVSSSEPARPIDPKPIRERLLRDLAELSRGLPQIGPLDPAGAVERSVASARPAQTPKNTQPRRGIIRRMLGR